MTRSLSAGVIAEIATNKLNPVELVYLGISTGTYYTDHYKDLSYDGNTYTA
jgi:fibrillarin-like rRNA methylase